VKESARTTGVNGKSILSTQLPNRVGRWVGRKLNYTILNIKYL
jgi:hypothetical protein